MDVNPTTRCLRILVTDPHRAIITEGCTPPYCTDGVGGNGRRYVLDENAPAFIVENVKVSLQHKTLRVDTASGSRRPPRLLARLTRGSCGSTWRSGPPAR